MFSIDFLQADSVGFVRFLKRAILASFTCISRRAGCSMPLPEGGKSLLNP
jgi:hypothetical protein